MDILDTVDGALESEELSYSWCRNIHLSTGFHL